MKKTKLKELSETYGCTPRTILRWQRDNAPLADGAAMRNWLAGRKNLPVKTLEKLMPTIERRAVQTADAGLLESGVVAALARLERSEARMFQALDAALLVGDPLQIRLARENWLRVGESLRRFDLAIEQNRRATGELVNKTTIEHALKVLAVSTRLCMEGALPTLAEKVMGERDQIRARQILRKSFYYGSTIGLSFALACQIPSWILDCFISDLSNELRGDIPAEVKNLAGVLKEAGEAIASKAIEETPPAPA
jgi:hypothetical protein